MDTLYELIIRSQKLENEKSRAADERIRAKEIALSNLEQRYQQELEEKIAR